MGKIFCYRKKKVMLMTIVSDKRHQWWFTTNSFTVSAGHQCHSKTWYCNCIIDKINLEKYLFYNHLNNYFCLSVIYENDFSKIAFIKKLIISFKVFTTIIL